MKRFISAVLFCSALLVCSSAFVVYRAEASEDDVIMRLLDLPAPPPPNPLMPVSGTRRSGDFYDREKPPPDDAPIGELMDYWGVVAATMSALRYTPTPSPRVMQRIMAELRRDPSELTAMMNIFREDEGGIRLVRDLYERGESGGSLTRAELDAMKTWLTNNSPYFSAELERSALKFKEDGEYVTGTDELVALATQDWDRAAPLVNRFYSSGSPIERVGALWALYKRALKDSSISDADRYRDELKAIVEDRNATAGMRDLAFDALVSEKEWAGRDDWYYSLLADETLAELRVNGSVYTGLTTIVLYSPADKYKDKMIELAASDNPVVRRAAIVNLGTLLTRTGDEKIVMALLPWLSDRNWAPDSAQTTRSALIRQLSHTKIAESVPGLINLLFEKPTREESEERARIYSGIYSNSANVAANAMRSATNSDARTAVNAAMSNVTATVANAARSAAEEDHYPHRYSAIMALQKQADLRAVPALRRLMGQTSDWEQGLVVKAILLSGGFTTMEIVDGMEAAARTADESGELSISRMNANAASNAPVYIPRELGEGGIKLSIGLMAAQLEMPSDELVQAAANRIESLDRREPQVAAAMRKMVLAWKGTAVNTMLLRDVKRGKASTDSVLKLLAERKEIREKQPTDIFDLRTGAPVAVALASCMLEDVNDMTALLAGNDSRATVAMLACARLLRSPLPVERVTPLLRSNDKILAMASERYLVSEDSPQARNAVLALHPNKAFITGATTHFSAGKGLPEVTDGYLLELFATVSPFYASSQYGTSAYHDGEFAELTKQVQEEVVSDEKLLGIYSYQDFFVRMYADRTVFSVQEDAARYRERTLSKEEFDGLRSFLAFHDVNDAPPFLDCSGYCEPRQLLMVGRNGGRRIFVKSESMPELFQGLDEMFTDFASGKMSLKYEAAKQIPGLEILFADDEMLANTVWKNGTDIRLFVANKAIRERVSKEIEDEYSRLLNLNLEEEEEEDASDERTSPYQRRADMIEKRSYEGIGWFRLANGQLIPGVERPADVMLPVLQDSHSIRPEFEQWKAMAAGIELRANEQGLFKVAGGKLMKIGTGSYWFPIITPNGRWAVVTKYDEESGPILVRVNLQTNRENIINVGETSADQAIVYIPAVNRILLGAEDYSEYDYEDEESSKSDSGFARPAFLKNSLLLLNPDSGIVQPAPGEYEPIMQQTFRRLQPTGGQNEYWAAIPDFDKNETTVVVYNAGNFGYRPVMKLPKIIFDSLDMWVDGGVIYFVYRGHLLSVPLPTR